MEYTKVENPVWANAEHTAINCVVTFQKIGTVPFTAVPNDIEAHGIEIFNRCASGEFGPVAEYAFDPYEGMVEGPISIVLPASDQPEVTGAQTL